MHGEVISVRVPKELRRDFDSFTKQEHLQISSEAARKLLILGLQRWKQEQALKQFAAGKLSLLKAASVAELSVWDFADLIKEKNLVWVKYNIKEELADIK